MHGAGSPLVRRNRVLGGARRGYACAPTAEPLREAIEVEVDDGRGVKSERLGDDEAADDGDTERLTQLRSHAGAESERQTAEQRGHGGHHDGAEAQEASLEDGL